MNKYLKYILSICFAGMFGVMFLPIMEVNTYRLSVFDILKMTLNSTQSVEFFKELQKIMYQHMFKYLILFAVAVALIVIAIALCILQDEKYVYKRSIIYALVINFYSSCVMFACYKSIKALDFSTKFFQKDPSISLYFVSIFIWEMVTLLIILISIVGVKMMQNEEYEFEEDIPETFQDHLNPFENQQDITSFDENPTELETQPEYNQFFEKANNQPTLKKDNVFEGMILNTNQKVLILKERVEVFITNNNKIDISRNKQGMVLGSIYYVSEYGEYCVHPLESMTVFLASGQPLGKNRFYYLPRGTEIYIKEQENTYKLC